MRTLGIEELRFQLVANSLCALALTILDHIDNKSARRIEDGDGISADA